jgi:hypothetical protein
MTASFSTWIAGTDLSEWIRATPWVVPMVQSVHILAVAAVMAAGAMMNLRLLGWIGRDSSTAILEGRYLPPIWIALLILLASGTVLVIGEPRRELLNPVFRAKMVLVIVAVGATHLLRRHARGPSGGWDLTPANRIGVRSLAFASLLLWLAILTAGRWIAYTGPDA